ncbi:MAG: hypothetical protein MUC90_07785 [Thermoplasmata archaeon]|nr:hypothetical protein [Thermoplasmata archaeon]
MTDTRTRWWLSVFPFLVLMILGVALLLLSASVWSSEEGYALDPLLATSGVLLLLVGLVAIAFLRLRG